MSIKTKKGGFALVPAGEQTLTVTSVKLVPSGKPQMVEFVHKHDSGATIKETLKFSNDIALDILGKRCDIALNGTQPEGTDIEYDELEDIFLNKTFVVEVVHKEGTEGRTFANIRYVKSLVETADEDDL